MASKETWALGWTECTCLMTRGAATKSANVLPLASPTCDSPIFCDVRSCDAFKGLLLDCRHKGPKLALCTDWSQHNLARFERGCDVLIGPETNGPYCSLKCGTPMQAPI